MSNQRTTVPPNLPPTMKAAIATGFGEIEDNIFVKNDWPTPQLPTTSSSSGWMIIRVLACALAPGDVRLLSGKTSYVQLPSTGHPYIPGSDVCGIVVQVSQDETKFRVGDKVISRFDEPKPVGGLAEYRLVKTQLSEILAPTTTVSSITACGLPASAMAAKRIVQDYMKAGDRVLVLGGSGAVGSCVIQYAVLYGASFVAATTTLTQGQLLAAAGEQQLLGANKNVQVIDYRTTNWWEVPEFQQDKFDVVFDMVNGDNWEKGGLSGKAIKKRGYYVALLSGVRTEIVCQGMFDMMRLGFEFLGRLLWVRLHPSLPNWVAPEALALKPGDLKGLFEDVDQGKLKMLVDPRSPFPFTEEGVRQAFVLQKSIHAHGKVVVQISQDS